MALAEHGRVDEAEHLLESAGMLGPIPTNVLLTPALAAADGCGSLRATLPSRPRSTCAYRSSESSDFDERPIL